MSGEGEEQPAVKQEAKIVALIVKDQAGSEVGLVGPGERSESERPSEAQARPSDCSAGASECPPQCLTRSRASTGAVTCMALLMAAWQETHVPVLSALLCCCSGPQVMFKVKPHTKLNKVCAWVVLRLVPS